MATSGRIETAAPAGKNSRFYVNWQLVGQNIENNTSTINWQAGLDISRWDLWYTNAVRIDGGNVHNQGIPGGAWSNIFGSTQLRSGTVVVQHNADGTGSFGAHINGWLYSFGNRTASGSWGLPTIPRATNPTMPGTVTLGQNATINLPRASSGFTHRVTYSFNGLSGVIAENAGSSAVWAVPTSLANARPNNTSGTGIVTVETRSGGTHIGTRSIGFTANIPNIPIFMPTVTGRSIEEANPEVSDHFSFFIQNKSRLKMSMTTQGAFGSTVSLTTFMYDNYLSDGSQNEVTDVPVPIAGLRFAGFIIVDSRARVANDMTYDLIEVEEYVNPFITAAFSRADNTGAWDEDGNHVIIYPGALIAPLRDENTHEFKLKYKKRSATSWTEVPITPTGAGPYGDYQLDFNDDVMLISGIDIDSPYDFVLEATDYFSTTQYPFVVPTAFTLMDFNASGRGVSFGRVSNNANRFEIGPKLPFNVIANTSDEPDFDLATFRRADDTLLAKVTTGPGGVGVKTEQYSAAGVRNGDFVFLNAHPVASIFMTTNSANPGTLYGGTWVAWGLGRVPVGVGNNGQTTYASAELTGGSDTVALTVAQLAAHTHDIFSSWDNNGGNHGDNFKYSKNASGSTDPPSFRNAGAGTAQFIRTAGSGQAHENRQSYITVYLWKRTV